MRELGPELFPSHAGPTTLDAVVRAAGLVFVVHALLYAHQ
jgi:hypothetical protein